MIKYINKYGKVGFDLSVFAAIAAETAAGFNDKVILTNQKGRPVNENRSGHEKYHFMDIKVNNDDNTVNIEIFLILKFGTSIKWFTKEFAERLRRNTEVITGITVDRIGINITGTKSRKIAKRELRIVC
jgi:uncharacterized alkaline shock family protein YloU